MSPSDGLEDPEFKVVRQRRFVDRKFLNQILVLGMGLCVAFMPDLTLADGQSDKIDDLFERWNRTDSPGASIAVVRNGKTIYAQGYGMANLEHEIPNSPRSVFHVASVSKQFTAFAIFLLENDEKLSLDDDIRKHIPELHDFGSKITIEHLIHHTSGLRDQWELLVLAGWRMEDVITHEDVMELVIRQRELNFLPGDRYLYCNSGYTLLAEIVKRVSGLSLREYCKKKIFVPLEMENTHFHDNHRQIVPHRTDCYQRRVGGWQKSVLSYAIVGATSLLTTTEDLAKWQHNFETRRLGNERVFKHVLTRGQLNDGTRMIYAGGLYYGQIQDHETVGHSGGDAGYRCHVMRVPDQELSVIVLANSNNVPTAQLANAIAKIYFQQPITKKPKIKKPSVEKTSPTKPNPLDRPKPTTNSTAKKTQALSISEIAGRYYSSELDINYEFIAVDEELMLQRRKYGVQRCLPKGGDRFHVLSGIRFQIDFQKNEETREVVSFTLSSGRIRNLKFLKQTPQ